MVKSMTGYGKVNAENEEITILVEIKTLNSKFTEFNLRLPQELNEKELHIRNLLSNMLERGKISLLVDVQQKVLNTPQVKINKPLFLSYYEQLLELAASVEANTSDIFRMAIQSPEVLTRDLSSNDISHAWPFIESAIIEAIDKCDSFRIEEGKALESELADHISSIDHALKEVIQVEPLRMNNVKERLFKNLEEGVSKDQIDSNRFEQEVIYYIEKLDIHEEIVRLATHLQYFMKVLSESKSLGKKLGFISQEIGREVNTIGSKANYADIQKLVVNMKEELEKIKEQVLNIV